MLRLKLAMLVAVIVLPACADEATQQAGIGGRDESSSGKSQQTGGGNQGPSSTTGDARGRIDPRSDGFEIGLGEWAITAEAAALRPGPVTFVVRNRGTVPHGFEIELEGESSGHGSGSLFKAETELLEPGESTRMKANLSAGVYKIECLVDGHDDRGMEDLLDVRPDAPLVKEKTPSDPGRVAIVDFDFSPEVTEVDAGTKVTWHNEDAAPHTVTATDGDFESNPMSEGESFAFEFRQPGTYPYRCAIHPEMKGAVRVR
ncbi:MAG: cupredoxin domain-containing protein [Actinomycetota bacterium]